jgi:4-amino-4-deoxy-L-arabinose transferase-like glycosyltransferase
MARLGILVALLALACGVQAWMIARAVVPAQDAVRYVLMAQAYERDGVLTALRAESEHPLYPLFVWLTHCTMTSVDWALCAQLAAAAMLVLSVVPLYGLLLRLVDERAAVAGTVFYCLMTPVARLGADALADSTQLCLIIAAMYCLVRRWWPICGILIGLALLARPEAVLLAPAIVLTLLWQREPWRRLATACCLLVAGIALVQLPYLLMTSSLTRNALVGRVLGRDQPVATAMPVEASSTKGWRTPDGRKMEFGIKDRSVSSRFAGHLAAVKEYLRELPEAFQYWLGALALAGVWQLRRSPLQTFGRFAIVLFVAHSLAAIHLSAGLGYLSARHLLPFVPLILAPAGYAAAHAGSWLWRRTGSTSRALGWATVVLAGVACLPKTLAPLHPNRAGHRQAGQWLAADQGSPGTVLDTRGWTALYSGRPTLRYDVAKAAYRRPDLAYVVIEQRELELDSARARTLSHLLSGAAEQVALFAAPEGRSQDNVLVYRWRPERFTKALRSGTR